MVVVGNGKFDQPIELHDDLRVSLWRSKDKYKSCVLIFNEMSSNSEVQLSSIVKTNRDTQECCVCFSVKDLTVVFPCQHHLCLSCFKQYAITNLNCRKFQYDPEIGYSLGCPCGCPKTLLTDSHIFRLMNKSNYERYKNFAAEEYVFYHHGVLCPTPSCGSGLILDQNNNKIFCPLPIGCGKSFCRSCKAVWVDENLRNCPCENQINHEELPPLSIWNRVFGNSRDRSPPKIKKCPTCHVNTEKDGGCNAISCTRCGMSWCWICQREFTTDCIQSHWF